MEPLTLVEQDVVVLQLSAHGGVGRAQDLVFGAFARQARMPTPPWLAYEGTGMPHLMRLSTWIGLGKSVPRQVVDALHAELAAAGAQVQREMGRWSHLGLNPFARLSAASGLEILVAEALVATPGRVVERGGASPKARGDRVAFDKAAALQALFFERGE